MYTAYFADFLYFKLFIRFVLMILHLFIIFYDISLTLMGKLPDFTYNMHMMQHDDAA